MCLECGDVRIGDAPVACRCTMPVRAQSDMLRAACRAAFLLAPLQESKQKLDHVTVLRCSVPGECKVRLFSTRQRSLEFPFEEFAMFPAHFEVIFEAFNSQISQYQFQGPAPLRE